MIQKLPAMAVTIGLTWFAFNVSAQDAAVPQLPGGAAQVLQLEQAKVSDSTILAFIQNSSASYNLTASQIIFAPAGRLGPHRHGHDQPAQGHGGCIGPGSGCFPAGGDGHTCGSFHRHRGATGGDVCAAAAALLLRPVLLPGLHITVTATGRRWRCHSAGVGAGADIGAGHGGFHGAPLTVTRIFF